MNKFIALLLFVFSVSAYANAPIEVGNISLLQIHNNPTSTSNSAQRFIVKLNGSVSTSSCGSSDFWTGALDNDAGRAQYSAILAAATSNKPIKLQGTAPNSCLSGNILIRNVYVVW
ncbi:hypothetical protein [Grimontia sp. NTOU-MAR1]|uniref:hypothetical protein n=1 Tax=Grimontia sp. NTOU-MAR1 TaxID=3111011 RepID=UPI002DBE028C|nr:hypothetical protein [Grimontia sp. NTOU-MAR1]WRV97960.1 hypothetical protein VP504_00530 [Grimontia sp. NTOU-MAR1]